MRTWGKERVVEACRHQTTYAIVKRMNFTPNVVEKHWRIEQSSDII